jgi:hypothetical protein
LASEDGVESGSEFAIIVVDQETQGGIPVIELPNQLSGLLGDPELVRVGSDASQIHPACPQFDEEEHKVCSQIVSTVNKSQARSCSL